MSMIYRTSIHWRNAFLNSAAASTAAAFTSVSFTSGSTIGSSCSNSRMMAMSIIRRTVSTSNSSGGEQAQATPNLTPDKSHNVLTRKKSEVCNLLFGVVMIYYREKKKGSRIDRFVCHH
jgi:hypothetical protein